MQARRPLLQTAAAGGRRTAAGLQVRLPRHRRPRVLRAGPRASVAMQTSVAPGTVLHCLAHGASRPGAADSWQQLADGCGRGGGWGRASALPNGAGPEDSKASTHSDSAI